MTQPGYVAARAATSQNVPPGTSRSAARPMAPPAQKIFTRTRVAIIISFAILGGLFSAKGMIGAPAQGAAAPQSVDVEDIGRKVRGDLALFEDEYQRHYGVLDTLK